MTDLEIVEQNILDRFTVREDHTLAVRNEIDKDSWTTITTKYCNDQTKIMWYIADLIYFGVRVWGVDAYKWVHDASGYSIATLKNARWVAESIPPDHRVRTVPYSLHKQVASLPAVVRRGFLEEADDNYWTWKVMETALRERQLLPVDPPSNTVPLVIPRGIQEVAIDAEFTEIERKPIQTLKDMEEFLLSLPQEYAPQVSECLTLLKNSPILVTSYSKKETNTEIGIVKGKTAKIFTPPTEEEAKAYGSTIGLPISQSVLFVDYWTSLGWKSRQGPLKDWQARMRTWKGNWEQKQPNKPVEYTTPAYTAEELARAAR
jgi:hypothetical protein